MSWIVNERENDWSLTWLNALIVTEWDITNWDGDPEITPVDGFRDRPIGSDPDVIENDKPSPVMEGVTENELFFAKTKEDWGYENEEIDWRMVNDRENDRSLTSFDALIVTDSIITNWEGEPDMTPVVELRNNPTGNDPDEIVNERSSPFTEGVIENDSFLDRT